MCSHLQYFLSHVNFSLDVTLCAFRCPLKPDIMTSAMSDLNEETYMVRPLITQQVSIIL